MGEIVVQKPDNPEDLDPGLGDPPFTELRGGDGGGGPVWNFYLIVPSAGRPSGEEPQLGKLPEAASA